MLVCLRQLAALFLKLGTVSFGGPAAHLALMEDEVVQRRKWLDSGEFLDLMGATHLIPGPNAVEMAAHIGYRRCGLLGSVVAGTCFTLPAVLLATVLAWSYVQCGEMPAIGPVLSGIKPAVLAVIFAAMWRLAKKALTRWQTVCIALGVVVGVLAGGDEVLTLLVGTLVGLFLLSHLRSKNDPPRTKSITTSLGILIGLFTSRAKVAGAVTTVGTVGTSAVAGTTVVATRVLLWKLGLFFLKVSAVLYGGGYVLVAYLEGGLVDQYGWLERAELLDAVAIGQITPGPMLSTATFVGYLVAGIPGAVVATLGMLIPCFFFVAVANPLITRIRDSVWASRFLDAVNAASIGLMAAVTLTLSSATLVERTHWLIAMVSAIVLIRWNPSPVWLVLSGAVAGLLLGVS